MGTLITDERKDIYTEELDFKSAVSERSWFKIGAAINFINRRQNNVFDFKFNGQFRPLLGGEDGGRGFIFDSEIVGISGLFRNSGSSGTTIVDIHLVRNSVDLGSIWSTRFQATFNAPKPSSFYSNLLLPDSYAPTGVTLPVFSATNFDKGDLLRVDLDQNASGAFDFSLNIHYRPR